MSGALILELLLKSGAIAVVGLGLSALLHFRPASDRVDVLRAAVCLLAALPLVMALAPALQLALLPPVEPSLAVPPPALWAGDLGPVAGVSFYASVLRPSFTDLVIGLYGLGAAVVIGRFALGVLALGRWSRSARPVTDPAWTAPLGRLDARERPRLLVSDAVGGPLSWGLPPGVVLIGRDQLRRADAAPAVLAHELAHLRRRDWLFLALSRVVLGLFWFNPMVWLLHAALIARSEEAADAAAVSEIDRQSYARSLVSLAADFHQPAALAMAGPVQTLTRRITCIMKARRPLPPRPLAMSLVVATLVAVATPIAAVELTPRAPQASVAPLPPVPPVAPVAPLPALPPLAPLAPPAPPAPPTPPALQEGSRIVITNNGQTRFYRSVEEMDPEARREYEQSLTEAAEARVQAAQAREDARAARAEAARARSEAHVHRTAALEQARTAVTEARAAAAEARVQARAAREEAGRAMARARIDMRAGADQMERGAAQMREEAVRLRDFAYRARQIEENRARGNTVTEAELIALSRRLPEQADEMEHQARRMREQAEDRV